MLTYDRIKESFVRALESAGLVSLDSGRHKQLSDLVDAHTDAVKKFLEQEEPEVVANSPKADPAAAASDAVEWLTSINLPDGWTFRVIQTTAHGAGRAVFAHYDVATQTTVAGTAHVHLIAPDKQIIDVQFKPDEGREAFHDLILKTIELYGNPAESAPESEAPNANQ